MAENPLQQLGERGQSVWLDFISRELVTTDELHRLVEDSNVAGLTSNPTIFEKAIAEGGSYDVQLEELLSEGVSSPAQLFFGLAISDIQHAADILRPVYDQTGGADGFVSLEVAPGVAHDTTATVEMARDLWTRVDRPNLMVKVPATSEGVPAIEQLIGDGINVNVTLIFAIESYENVIQAYLRGLERRRDEGKALDVHSVASFFVSRVDVEVDPRLKKMLEDKPGDRAVERLLGKAAIANARLAYERFEEHFRNGDRFKELAKAGALVQRPLWASTSAKDPKYRDVVYAEALIGPDTVDTMPPATVEAFRDHGVVAGDTARDDWDGAHATIDQLRSVGIDIVEVTEKLLSDGVASFAKSFDGLIQVIAEKSDRMRGGYATERQRLSLGAAGGALDGYLHSDSAAEVARRIWARDPALWKPGDEEHAKVIGNRLGWLGVIDTMRESVPRLLGLHRTAHDEGIRDVVLLGMGGSSLAPEVLRSSFGSAAGSPTLHVLDTTDPAAIMAVGAAINPATTWFVVASKSGGTVETLSHLAHFWQVVESVGVANPGRHFIAITDPGTSLATLATDRGFRELFENPADIGGRYSALSFFGLVPAALLGIEVDRFLDRAADMRRACGPELPGQLNCGLTLGAALGSLGPAGDDKVTILAPARIANFSLWAEQLIAESTGKEGKGLIPIGAEPIGEPGVYGDDRLFVALDLEADSDADVSRGVAALRQAGRPVITLQLRDLYDLAAEFFRWEFATAVAGAALRIDPFDEPNVAESKENTRKLLGTFEQDGRLPAQPAPTATDGPLQAYGGEGDTVGAALESLLRQAGEGDYIALMAYVTPTNENLQALQALRVVIRDRHRRATTMGFGPRFLHSTGQLHKGGPDTGVYVQLVGRDTVDCEIPGQKYTFSVLKQAQADGDLASLRDHGRRVMRVAASDNLTHVLAHLTESLRLATPTATSGAPR
ncbi:MAG: bifunctional transaldolase/phosoglucose isomerase [Candidatus Dormibacteria bacterium]